jgi:mono/diheme cytochrome c family protein
MSLRFQAAVLVAVALAAASCSRSDTTTETTDTADSTSARAAAMTPIQRGQYLAIISGCHDCHTPGTLYGAPDMSRALSGSELGWKGAWGVSYAPNLTPDPTTGLGSWTDEQILRALQTGVDKEGAPIAPPMPWASYAHLTSQDAMAIVAYLRSIPAVIHRSPERVPPSGTPLTPVLEFPPPPAWDVPAKPSS